MQQLVYAFKPLSNYRFDNPGIAKKEIFIRPVMKALISTLVISLTFIPFKAKSQNDNLNGLKKNDEPLRYVAIGSSLSAGVRDAGLYRESQISAFPNLIAKQMGLTDFRQPLFDLSEKNGIGFKKVQKKNGVLIFSKVTEMTAPEKKLPKVVGRIDNLSIPFLKVSNISVSENMKGAFLPTFERSSYDHMHRFVKDDQNEGVSYLSLIQQEIDQVDFFTFEIGMHDFVSYYKNGGYGQSISMMHHDREGYFPENEIIQHLISKGGKGVLCNVPDVLKFPFFQQYRYDDIKGINGERVFAQFHWRGYVRNLNPNDIIIPDDYTNVLFTNVGYIGHSKEQPLLDEYVIGDEEKIDIKIYNRWINAIADINKIPIVDLNSLYARIIEGDYVTDDGLLIDPSYPEGNFFSSDGIHPTQIGQAVIANEFIKTTNSYYGTKIPLISIKDLK
ncbi:hypothetical protein GVN16_09840 [Emticicia sp. CRIBPO]|uniref:SGNH/GDSL hydrolase family protein n=1 Tax=Emticicia sp. CRIBPO TaxID=2683258 RepID=UPI001412C3DD|nr:SGNH/GDSL hydrolase family protein [Emticicia sp. CRIBPO]NBA86063.1 hypothetical protein [Emticicia sp. CRIBPO]